MHLASGTQLGPYEMLVPIGNAGISAGGHSAPPPSTSERQP